MENDVYSKIANKVSFPSSPHANFIFYAVLHCSSVT
jgi:hypothetical protein